MVYTGNCLQQASADDAINVPPLLISQIIVCMQVRMAVPCTGFYLAAARTAALTCFSMARHMAALTVPCLVPLTEA